MICRELRQDPAAAQFVGVVHDRFEAQHVLTFGVGLQGQRPEVDLEQGQAIPSLDHDCECGWPGRPVGVGTVLRAEQRLQGRHVEPCPGPVDHPVEDLLHPPAGPKHQVPAVLGLVDRVGVAETAALLLVEVQAETQTGRVDPPVAGLAQAPYSR